jgi:hypothetical protein
MRLLGSRRGRLCWFVLVFRVNEKIGHRRMVELAHAGDCATVEDLETVLFDSQWYVCG